MANRVMRTRQGQSFRGSGVRRQTEWQAIPIVSSSQASIGGVILNVPTAALDAQRPFTVVRTIITGHLISDQSAGGEVQLAAVGFAVVSDQALAVGITSVPTPITDAQSDLWFLHDWVLGSGSAVNDGRVGFGFKIESRAMRKVEDGQSPILVSEFSATGDGWTMITAGRMLIKTH